MANKTGKGTWKPGQSGNPRGNRPGSGRVQKLRAALDKHVPKILEKLVASALAGDVQAARLVLERAIPPMRATEAANAFTLDTTATLTDQSRAVMKAVAAGQLAPTHGAQLLTALATMGKIVEMDEQERRLAALEGRHGTGT